VALQRREFNIVSNDYVRDHEKKAEAEAQRTKAELVDKFWRAPPRPAARTAMHAASLGHSFVRHGCGSTVSRSVRRSA
jgi:hypothetical protein